MRNYLIGLRKAKGLTQNEASSALGISRSFYGAIESGARNPTLKLAKTIADFFNESPGNIFFDQHDTKRVN